MVLLAVTHDEPSLASLPRVTSTWRAAADADAIESTESATVARARAARERKLARAGEAGMGRPSSGNLRPAGGPRPPGAAGATQKVMTIAPSASSLLTRI